MQNRAEEKGKRRFILSSNRLKNKLLINDLFKYFWLDL